MIAQPTTLPASKGSSFVLGRTWNLPLLALHLPLGVAMSTSPMITTLHAYSTCLLALAYALRRSTIDKATYMICYIGCCDVLWRMNGARFPWEGGKYAVIGLALSVWIQHPKLTRPARSGLLLLILLLPSCFETLSFLGVTEAARQAISFNLSGTATIAAAVVFFSTVPSNRISIESILKAIVAPILATFAVASSEMLTATNLAFGNEANFTASGGYGPNQVSSLLGLGALASLILLLRSQKLFHRALWLGVICGLAVQTILTFSRGGTFNLLIAVAVLGLHYMPSRRDRHVYLATAVLALVAFWSAIPLLTRITGGAFETRFTSTSTTGRAEIGSSEIDLWLEHPILGAGPGLSSYERQYRPGVASHTEYTRLLSEHGAFGLAAILMMLWIVVSAYTRAPSLMTRAWVATFAVWCLASMLHTAMRFSAVGLLFGLITLEWRRAYVPRKEGS